MTDMSFVELEDDKENEIELIEKWLRAKQVTLWQSWDVTNRESRRAAAEWVYNTLDELAVWYKHEGR